MGYVTKRITLSNVESIVNGLSSKWIGNETWLAEFALNLNSRYKELRDDLRQNKTTWSHVQYSERLAYHYYDISSMFNDLFIKYKVDLQSVIKWMEKCLEVIGEIPRGKITKNLMNLSNDAVNYLAEMGRLEDNLNNMRKASAHEKYTELSTALGDVTRNEILDKFLNNCEKENRVLWEKKLQNITLVRVLAFLEDSLTNPDSHNLLCASAVSLCLANVYSVIGVTFLSERFKNTHERLLKACLSPPIKTADPREKIENIIVELMTEKCSLQQTKTTIQETFGKQLSNVDETYIERKYYSLCFDLFVKESVDFLKELTEQKNRQVIMSIVPLLKCSESLPQIPHPLNQMEYYFLLEQNYNLMRKEDEKQLMKNFKRECFLMIIEYVNLAKNELLFLETFIEFLGSFKDASYLEAVLDLRHFCISDSPFGELIQNVLNLQKDKFGEELSAVQLVAEPLKNETDLFYVDKFKEFVLANLKQPEIRMEELDGRGVLEVCGKKIVISEVTSQDRFKDILANPSCEEVRFIATNVIHVDENFTKSSWHGKNVVVIAKTLRVHDTPVWDVSGNDCSHTFSSRAETLPDGNGKLGQDGIAGESGGNVFILVETMMNSNKFTITSNGGKGGNGQDGGNGRDGCDGTSIDKADFQKKFPPVAKTMTPRRWPLLLTTMESILNYSSTIKTKWYERPVTSVWKWIPGATFYKRELMSDSICHETNLDNIITDLKVDSTDPHDTFNGNVYIEATTRDGNDIVFSYERGGKTTNCQGFLLFKGSLGKPGCKGGEYGLGGQGGFPGDVIVRSPNDFSFKFDLVVNSSQGEDGANGEGGNHGNHGTNGWDMGYMDYSVSNFFTEPWPKSFGDNRDSKITICYYEQDNNKRIWCPYRRYKDYSERWASMEAGRIDNKKDKKYQETTNTRSNYQRESRSKATRKKTISQGQVASHYQHHFNSLEKTAVQNLFSELEDANTEIIQAIDENQKEQEQVTEQVQVTRCRSFNDKRKADLSEGNTAPIERKIGPENVELVVSNLIKHPLPIDSWMTLKHVQVAKSQLNKLFATFETIVGQMIDQKQVADIQTMLLAKYRFATLLEISLELKSTAHSSDTQRINATSAGKYLSIAKEGSNDISHPILGRLNQYLFSSNEEERKKMSRYCREELKIEGNISKSIISFVMEAKKSGDSNPKINEWCQKYTFFHDKRKRGFITFPESFEKLDREFSEELIKSTNDGKWKEDKGSILYQFVNNVERRGCKSISCIELLAYIYDANIRLYSETNDENHPFFFIGNVNPGSESSVYVLYRPEECIPVNVDLEFWKLEQQRVIDGFQFLKVLNDTEKLKDKCEVDEYLKSKSFKENISDEDLEHLGENSPSSSGKTIGKIMEYFQSIEDKVLLGVMLHKLSPEYIGRTNILDNVLEKFSSEGRHISVQELLCFINSMLNNVAEGRNCQNIYQWIVVAHPQDQWIDEVLLLEIETFFKKSSKQMSTWRNYMYRIGDKRILLILREKLQRFANNTSLDIQCLEEVLHLLSKIPTGSLRLEELGIAEWPSALKEQYFTTKLSQLLDWNCDELSIASYYTLAIENIHGSVLVDKLLDILLNRKNELNSVLVSTIISSLYSEQWSLSDKELQMFAGCRSVHVWVNQMREKFMITDYERDINHLVELVNINSNTSANVKKMLPFVKKIINRISRNAIDSTILKNKRVIHELKESDIKDWANALNEKLKTFEDDKGKQDYLDGMCEEMLAVIDKAIQLKRSFRLRDTQRLAVLMLLKNDKSTLAQVATGEGKSLIVVATSIMKALKGEKVDIITSSSVLAKRDAELNKDIYQIFGVNVSHNCNEDIEKRKAAYSGNQVVYGDLSDFQRDYLLHEFYNINVLGDRNFQSVVVDEVDSMLLDKGNNMLYLSHGIPGLDKLESVYIFIWQWINRPCKGRENVLNTFDVKKINEAVLYDLYGLIGKADIKELDSKITDQQACAIWERLIAFNIIDSQAKLLIEKVDRSVIEKLLPSNFKSYTDRLCYLINECLWRDRQIHVPNNLKPFIESHAKTWIKNAIHAFFMKPGEDYVVDVDRTGMSADRNPNITIIDKDTGTDQSNSQWEEALHQFLQLKHGCKLSIQTLKAVFISNVSYFKLYKNLYGLTGTLGSEGERKLLEEVHEAEFVTIPTAKVKQFHEDLPTVRSGEESWCSTIRDVSLQLISKNRSILVICESVNDVDVLRQCFEGKETCTIQTYTREYEEFNVTESKEELGPGHVIIATNLAGRGTDIKIDKDLKSAGGLHVILSYLPNNARIEEQAFGRAARCGEKGSGQLIIKSSDKTDAGSSKILSLKRKRNTEELKRISEIKTYYENQICVEEECFSEFKRQYNELKQLFHKTVTVDNGPYGGKQKVNVRTAPEEVEKILLRSCVDKWAFWLDENSKRIKSRSSCKGKNDLDESLKKFISQLKCLSCEAVDDWISWVGNYPIPVIELGKYCLRKEKYATAQRLFESAIKMEPNFSEAAHYYKAGTLGNLINWESPSSSDYASMRALRNELRQAAKMFDGLGNQAMQNSAVVNQMKRTNKQSIIQIEAYEEQQKKIANLYHMFSQSIQDMVGHAVTPQSFTNYDFKDVMVHKLHRHLLREGILKYAEVNFGNDILQDELETNLETLSCGYNIPVTDLKSFLDKHKGKTIKSFRDFKAAMKEGIRLPSKENFWKELTREKILVNEIKFVIVDDTKLSEIDPSLLDTFSGLSNLATSKSRFDQEEKHIFLNAEQFPEQKKKDYVFFKEDLMKLTGRNRYLALKQAEVFSFNRKCKVDVEKLKLFVGDDSSTKDSPNKPKAAQRKLPAYDSITLDDFTRNKVIEADAKIILKELIEQKVIIEIAESGKYSLVMRHNDIGNINLSFPVYVQTTICLLKMCFAYRIALQKLLEQMEGKSPFIFHLKTKPYLSLFWNLYESNFISPIKVRKGENWKEVVEKAFSTNISKSELDQLLTEDFCVPQETTDALMINMLTNKWLIPPASWVAANDLANLARQFTDDPMVDMLTNKGSIPTSVEIQGDKNKWGTLDKNCKNYEKTARTILEDALKLSNELSVVNISQALEKMKSKLENLKVPKFGLKPLADACAEGDFSNAQEIYGFFLNGLDVLLTLEEKKYTWEMILNTTIVIIMGICQIAIGALIEMYSVGFMTHVGNAFISEGVSDIMFALGAVRSGYFSWKDYRTHKIESLMFTVLSVGIGAYWSRGTKFSRVGQELTAPGVMIAEKKATEVAGAEVLKTINKSIGKQLIKQISLKTVEGVGYGIANMVVDSVVENFLQSLSEGAAAEIMNNIEKEVADHSVSSKLRTVYNSMSESDARAMISDLTLQYFRKKSAWEQLGTTSGKIFSSLSRGIAEATSKNVSSGQSAGKLQTWLHNVNRVLVWGERAKHLLEIRQMTGKLLDGLAEAIDKHMSDRRTTSTVSTDRNESDYIRFRNEITEDWKRQIRERSGQIISQQIINPLLKDGAHKLVRFGGRKIKEFYRSCKEEGYAGLFDEYKQQYEEDIEAAGDDIARRNKITKEYHQNMIKLLSKTRSPKLFADIIKENVPMDMTCLQACMKILPIILRRQGVHENFKFVIEKEGDNVKQEIGSDGEDVKVIRLRVKDNHFELIQNDGQAVNGFSGESDLIDNNCLYWALSEHFDLQMSDAEFRHIIAKTIEEDSEMQSIVQQGWHEFGIAANLYGGRHAYEREDCYTFSSVIDQDYCRGEWETQDDGTEKWVEHTMTVEEINEQRTTAYQSALTKLNEVVTGRGGIEGWENCELIDPSDKIKPEDFKTTIFDTIRTTGDHGKVSKALYPVEIHTTIKVKKDGQILVYDVEINSDTVIGDQRGPQGPHIGYKIKRMQKTGPKTVTGHYLLNDTGNPKHPTNPILNETVHSGNKYMPRRQRYSGGGVYIAGETYIPEDIIQIPPYRLFSGPRIMGAHLEREEQQTSRNRNYPKYYF